MKSQIFRYGKDEWELKRLMFVKIFLPCWNHEKEKTVSFINLISTITKNEKMKLEKQEKEVEKEAPWVAY